MYQETVKENKITTIDRDIIFPSEVAEGHIFKQVFDWSGVGSGLILQLAVLVVPFMRHAFRLEMLDVNEWLTVIGLGLVPFTINEIVKTLIRIRKKVLT